MVMPEYTENETRHAAHSQTKFLLRCQKQILCWYVWGRRRDCKRSSDAGKWLPLLEQKQYLYISNRV